MAFLIIDTLQAVGIASSVPVTVELTDGRGDPITGYVTASAEVIVFPTVVLTDANGHADIDLVPNADITPGGSCYTVRIAEKQFLIRKSGSNQTLLDAIITDVTPLTPVETNDLLDHINDPFNAHGASAISVIPNADLLGVNVQGALEELQAEILDHVEDVSAAHQASAIGISPVGDLASDNVQDALEELQTDLDTEEAALAAHVFDISDAHAATAIGFNPAGDIISGTVQSAIEEVDTELHAHVDDIADAHDGSAISIVPFATIGSTNVQDALEELFTEASGVSSAEDVSFDPAGTISSTNVQDAIEELDGDVQTVTTAFANHLTDSVDAHDASAISAIPFGLVASSDVQNQLEELYALAVTGLDEASEISFAPTGDIVATDVQAAIVEVDGELHAHEADTTDAHDASAISFVPTGDISATDVQAAIVELNAETADYTDPRIVRSDAANTDSGELIGFVSRAQSTISMVNAGATNTLTLTPVSGSFTVWAAATRYVKSSPEVVALPHTSGLQYVYYNSSGTLVYNSVKWNWDTDAPVGVYYWSTAAGAAFFIDERHGVNMDNDTQQWLSEVAGSRIVSGIIPANYTLSPASPVNADVTFSTSAGLIVDADIQYTIPAVAVGGGAGGYGIFYRTGTSEWTITTSTVPVKAGTTYPMWNENGAGTWQLTESANGDFMNYWLLAVPTPLNGLRSYILVPGEATYASLAGALAESETTSPLLASFPFREAISHFRITIQNGNAYGTTGKFRIRQVTQLEGRSITNVASTQTTDHAILLNRSQTDQHPAMAITNTPAGTISSTDVQSAINELDTDNVADAAALAAHLADTVDAHDASAISVVPFATIAATDVQSALAEIVSEFGGAPPASSVTFTPTGDIVATNVQTAIVEVDGELHAHEALATDAHDASAISFVPTGTVGSTTVQAAIAEVASEAASDLSAHLVDTVAAHAASAVAFTPTGTIAATDAQAAIAEVATDSAALYVPKTGTYASSSTGVLANKVTADSVDRYALAAGGLMEWGSGAATRDTNLYRGAADQLKTDDSLYVVGGVGIGITPNVASAALILPTGTAPAQGILFDTDTNLYRSAADTLTTDDKFTAGNRIQAALSTTAGGFQHGSTGPIEVAGTGSPEGVVTAVIGSKFFRTDGGTNTATYTKESGTGNTGWVANGNTASFVSTGTPAGTPKTGDIWYDTDDVAPAYVASNVTNTALTHLSTTTVQSSLEAIAKGVVAKDLVGSTQNLTATGAYSTGSITFTADALRLYRVFLGITWSTSASTDQWDITLREGGTDLGNSFRFFTTAGQSVGFSSTGVLYQPTSGSKTLDLNCTKATGAASTLTMFGGTFGLAFYVEDVGLR